MGKIVATEFISLDGVIEDPGGSEDFVHGGWTFEIDRGDEGNKFKLDELEEAEAQLLGRVTYEGFADAWPEREGDPNMGGFAKKMNTMPKYVFSTTLESADWQNTTVLSRDFAEDIRKIKDEVDGVILVAGSAALVQGLIVNDLLDELRLMVFPVTLGGGKRLFADDGRKVPLTLTDARTVGAGIQVLTYGRS
ncbi:MAG TPA: dihydrofolate reductase family protein [Solirubrobacterales bacterium]|jgi:dihydrofolate reductase